MKIDMIQIGSFGKFKETTLEFTDGFQVISEKNEYGKSTIMAFIELMFYGKVSNSRDITVNLRKKYTPWDGSKMNGAIEFTYGDAVYRLEKEFGKSAAADKVTLINKMNGNHIPIAKEEEVGTKFFHMDVKGFEKSIFIGGLGGFSGDGDKDSIAEKISNLATAADEDISAERVMQRLKEAKEGLVSKSEKSGALIKIKEEIEMLTMEQNRLKAFEEVQAEERRKYQHIKIREENLQKLSNLLKHKIQIQNLEEIIESDAVFQAALKKLDCLGIPYEGLKAFMEECENRYKKLLHEQQSIKKMVQEKTRHISPEENEELHRAERDKETIKELLHKAEGLKAAANKKRIEEQEERNTLEKKLRSIEKMREDSKVALGKHDSEKLIERKEQLHLQFLQCNLQEEQEESRLQKASHVSGNLLFGGVAVFLLAVLAMILSQSPLIARTLVILAAILVTAALIYRRKKAKRRKDLHSGIAKPESKPTISFAGESAFTDEQKHATNYEAILQEMKRVENALEQYRKSQETYRAFDMEIKVLAEQAERYNKAVKEAKLKLEEEEKQIEQYQIKLRELEGSIIRQLEIAACRSTEEFHRNYIEGETYLAQIRQSGQLLEEQRQEFKKLLSFVPEHADDEEYVTAYKSLRGHYEIAQNERNRRETLASAYGYEAASLEECIEEQIACNDEVMQIKEDIQNQESMVEEQKELNELIKIQDKNTLREWKEKTDKRFYETMEKRKMIGERLKSPDKNPLSIARKLEELKESKTDMESYYKAVCAANEVMEETIDQVRQSFGPVLNEHTGGILSALTDGKYENAIVSKDYGIQVLGAADIHLREWKYLSSGTVDQMYLALRIAITKLVTQQGESLPMFLDDVLARYDEERTRKAIAFFKEYGRNHQVILFTCHSYLY